MKNHLFDISLDKLLTRGKVYDEEITFIIDTLLRYEFILRDKLELADDCTDEIKSGYQSGISDINYSEMVLLKILNNSGDINEFEDDLDYILKTLIPGLNQIFGNLEINEDRFSEWIKTKQEGKNENK